MKDIIITSERIKKELRVILLCFAIAFMVNVGAIIAFKTPWYEMFTQIGYVIVITLLLYLVVLIIRLIWHAIKRLLRKTETERA